MLSHHYLMFDGYHIGNFFLSCLVHCFLLALTNNKTMISAVVKLSVSKSWNVIAETQIDTKKIRIGPDIRLN